MFLSDHFINEELWENFMDAILLLVLIPHEGEKSYIPYREWSRKRHQIWGKDWKLPKKQTKNNLSSSNGLAETCEEPTLIIYHKALSFSRVTCVICVAQMVKETSFLAMHYFITHGMQPWKKQCKNNKVQPA